MLKHSALTLGRIEQFISREIKPQLFPKQVPLSAEFCRPAGRADVPESGPDGQWKPIEPGTHWGPAYSFAWYRVRGLVPSEFAGQEIGVVHGPIELVHSQGGAAEMTFFQGEVAIGGLDFGHQVLRLGVAQGEQPLEWLVQTYAHNKETTVHGKEQPRTPEPEPFKGFHLVTIDQEMVQLFFDLEFGLDMLKNTLGETDPAHAGLLRALNDVCNLFATDQPKAVARARKRIKDALGEVNCELNHSVTAVGHAHLDTAWLWPLAVTRFKMAHTSSIQLGLIERFPEYVFSHSQASQYEWLEKTQPELFDRIKVGIGKGQWEPVGSMWVEADCNLSGGEALVRQFLYGRRYFQAKLGYVTEDMWLPDVFGYSAALPQILTKFGIKYFLTQKMSWNQFNKMPHHTFWWQGLDGSRVWTHFPPADTYNGSGYPSELAKSVEKYRDHGRCNHSLLPTGHGDGGGGPSEFHLELLRRARTAPCLPVIESKKRAIDFFRTAYAESQDLLTWAGELYFEYHRGTYTSQAANKRGNRECEFLMRDAELLACFRDDFPTGYPAEELERLWKLVLLNQFHDIIPGSSVREVYQDSDQDYAEIRQGANALIEDSLKRIAEKIDTRDMSRPVALFQNATIGAQGELPWTEAETPASLKVGDERHPVQLVEAFGERKLIFPTPSEALGAVVVGDLSDRAPTLETRLKAGARRIENSEFTVRFDPNGNITSIQTLEDNPIEFIEPGKLANLFQILDDKPLFWSAWDTDVFSQETTRDLVRSESFEVVEKGPVRVAVELTKRFGKSTIKQRISLGPTPGIRFDTWVDWQEEDKFLKVAFPLRIHSSRATFEVQFGHVERPTHRNTTWDMAKFEVCAQKWADLSEGGYGVALLNEGKYGHDVNGNVLRLSLLRSPKAPDPLCDMGEHRFTYVLLPHYDQVQHSDVVAASYALNAPLRAVPIQPSEGVNGEVPRLLSCDDRSIVIESVKKSEEGEQILARLYECHNTRGRATLSCARPVRRAWLADLNERPLAELEVQDGAVTLDYKPFEILTVLLEV